jgi:hypothetical protein
MLSPSAICILTELVGSVGNPNASDLYAGDAVSCVTTAILTHVVCCLPHFIHVNATTLSFNIYSNSSFALTQSFDAMYCDTDSVVK